MTKFYQEDFYDDTRNQVIRRRPIPLQKAAHVGPYQAEADVSVKLHWYGATEYEP